MHASSLNHIYRVVWNAATGTWQAVSEITAARGKSKGGKAARARALSAALLGAGLSSAMAQQAPPAAVATPALPTGGQVVAGQAALSQSGSTLTITQGSARAAIDWQSFNVGQGHTVNFVQPSAQAVALNRVLGSDVSVIQGAINANGQVFLVNPNGVLFTPTAQVNVGGLVAATQSISTADFMAGQYRFSGSSAAEVRNQGHITALDRGTVALVAARIVNTGQINAHRGQVLMGAGRAVTLDLGGPVKIVVKEGALDALIAQGGGIRADGGLVYLTAKAAGDLASASINHTGITQAQTLTTGEQGQIILISDMASGTTTVDGTLDASAQTGNGGFIETSAAKVRVADSANISTKAHNTNGGTGQTGTWLIDPNDYTIAASVGDISGAQLSANLALNNITIQSLQGATAGNGDIVVNDSIDATGSGNTLTLQAERDINVNKTVKVDGLNLTAVRDVNVNNVVDVGASLTVNYAANTDFTANTAVRPSGNGALNMKMNGNGFVGKINLGASATAIINGNSYTVLRTASELAAIPANTTNRYVLANDVSLAAFADWISNNFFGSLDGLGHEVSGLSITSNRANGGFFAIVGNNINNPPTVSNLGVSGNINFTNNSAGVRSAGGLAAYAGGASILRNVYSNVSVAVDSSSSTILGGLIGSVANTSTLTNAFARGVVTASSNAGLATSHSAGGLIGQIGSGTASIANVYALGAVSASGATLANVGGLIGNVGSSLTLRYAYATGAASATTTGGSVNAGGLLGTFGVGANNVSVDNVFATGAVSGGGGGTLRLGGLVGNLGSNTGGTKTLSSAYWDATKTGQNSVFSTNTQAQPNAITNVESSNIGATDATFPQLDSTVWDVINGTPSLKAMTSDLSTIALNYTFNTLTGTYTYKAAEFALGELWSASTLFGGAYSDWVAGTDFAFTYGGNIVTGFTNAGTYTGLDVTILKTGFSAAPSGNTTGSFTIAPAKLTGVTGITASNKTYDGATTATLNTSAAQFTGLLQADAGKVSVASATGNFADKNAGTGKTVNITNITLGGTSAGNYVLDNSTTQPVAAPNTANTATTTATIEKKDLTVTATQVSKTYDGGTSATGTGTVGTLVSGDMVNSAGSQAFVDKNAGTGKTVKASGVTLKDANGADMIGNYAITYVDNTTSIISAKELTISGFAASNKTYDGTTTASITNAGSLVGVVQADAAKVSLDNTGATFADKNASTGKTVTLNGTSLSGDEAANYKLATAAVTTMADISAKELTVSGFAASNKTYDGTTAASITNAGSLQGVVQADAGKVSLGNTDATFSDKNAATGKTVTLNGTSLSGDEAGNYKLTSAPVTTTANITAKELTISGFAASGKTYDGTTAATITNAGSLVGVLDADAAKVTLGNSGATFSDKNAATGKTVTLNGTSLSGAEAANYTLAAAAVTTTADIAKRALTVTATPASKVFDGNTSAPGAGEVGALVAGDVVSQAGSQAFQDSQVGINKPVRASGVAIADGNGADMTANYAITYVDTNTGTIRQLAPDAVLATAAQLAQTATLSLGGRSLQASQSGGSSLGFGLSPVVASATGVPGVSGATTTGEAPGSGNPSSGLQFVAVPPGTFIDSGALAGILRIGVVNGGINLNAPR